MDYSGNMEFRYREGGTLKDASYCKSSYTHGTFDSSGYIIYDEKGRMTVNDYYVTHGGDDVYLFLPN